MSVGLFRTASAVALTIAAAAAHAAPITGSFSIIGVGGFAAYNGPGYTNLASDIATANVLDFGNNLGGSGNWAPNSGACSGDFVAVLAPCTPVSPIGTILDLVIPGAPGALSIPGFMTSINGLIFNLQTITLIDRAVANQVTLKGTGTIVANGFDLTPATWNFTGNNGGTTFSWSASDTAIGRVPEPGSLGLLGALLVSAVIGRRRKVGAESLC